MVLPLALAAPGGAEDVQQIERALSEAMKGGMPQAPAWLGEIPLAGANAAALWNRWADDLTAMVTFFQP